MGEGRHQAHGPSARRRLNPPCPSLGDTWHSGPGLHPCRRVQRDKVSGAAATGACWPRPATHHTPMCTRPPAAAHLVQPFQQLGQQGRARGRAVLLPRHALRVDAQRCAALRRRARPSGRPFCEPWVRQHLRPGAARGSHSPSCDAPRWAWRGMHRRLHHCFRASTSLRHTCWMVGRCPGSSTSRRLIRSLALQPGQQAAR